MIDSLFSSLPGAPNAVQFRNERSHYLASLFAPDVVAKATAHIPAELRKSNGCWALCGDVTTGMYELMKTSGTGVLAMNLAGFSTSSGVSCCALIQQAGSYQHRFLLPLFDPGVRRFIESLAVSESVVFNFGNNGGDDSMVLPCLSSADEFKQVLDEYQPVPLEQALAAVGELAVVQALTGVALLMPSLIPGIPVSHVSVSTVMPIALLDKLRFGKPSGYRVKRVNH